jgi:prophage antirepressor-like protein
MSEVLKRNYTDHRKPCVLTTWDVVVFYLQSMQELQKAGEFTHNLFGSLTTVKNEAGDIFFIGKEVVNVLGYQNTAETINKFVDDEDKIKMNNSDLLLLGIDSGRKGETLISESGLYSLVLSSKIEGAKAFKRWVTSEVLPDIRKKGIYATPMTVDKMLDDPDFAIELLQKYKHEKAEKQKAIQQVENLNTVLDNLLEWVSILKVSKFNKVSEKHFDWRVLKKKSEDLGYTIKKAESPRYGYQNLYHITVFKACYPEYNYKMI